MTSGDKYILRFRCSKKRGQNRNLRHMLCFPSQKDFIGTNYPQASKKYAIVGRGQEEFRLEVDEAEATIATATSAVFPPEVQRNMRRRFSTLQQNQMVNRGKQHCWQGPVTFSEVRSSV